MRRRQLHEMLLMGQDEDGELAKGLNNTGVNVILDKSRLGRLGGEKSKAEGN